MGKTFHTTVDSFPEDTWGTTDSLGMTSSLWLFPAAGAGSFKKAEFKMGPQENRKGIHLHALLWGE